jgi:hypothetical protein
MYSEKSRAHVFEAIFEMGFMNVVAPTVGAGGKSDSTHWLFPKPLKQSVPKNDAKNLK